MSRFPDRDKPKGTLLVKIEESLTCVPEMFKNHPSGAFSSVSSYVETLIFLIMDMCTELNIENKVLREFAKTKFETCISSNSSYKDQVVKRVHISLDTDVIDFLKCMRKHHSDIFSSQSEIMNLILTKAKEYTNDEFKKTHHIQRLHEVLRKHPTRNYRLY